MWVAASTKYPHALRDRAHCNNSDGCISTTFPEITDMRKAWLYLPHARSNYIEFVPDAWWQPGNFDTALRPSVREAVAARLRGARTST